MRHFALAAEAVDRRREILQGLARSLAQGLFGVVTPLDMRASLAHAGLAFSCGRDVKFVCPGPRFSRAARRVPRHCPLCGSARIGIQTGNGASYAAGEGL